MHAVTLFLSLLSTLALPSHATTVRPRPGTAPRGAVAVRQTPARGSRDEACTLPLPPHVHRADPLTIATDEYYWKPMTGFHRAFELRSYVEGDVQLESPMLDLGCSDGTFARMISRLLGPVDDVFGADINLSTMAEARDHADRKHRGLAASDARRLPFAAESFNSVVANGVVNCMPDNLLGALQEVTRILRPGGQFLATVHTSEYGRHFWLNKVLRAVGLGNLGESYRNRLDRRMNHEQTLSTPAWVGMFETAGLRVDNVIGFCPPAVTVRWSMLASHAFRFHGLLKRVPLTRVRRAVSTIHRGLFGRFYRATSLCRCPEESGYILIHARKPA